MRGRDHCIWSAVVLMATLVFAVPSLAQQGAENKKRTTINFEDELIQGEVKKPELLYLLQRKQFNFKKLIQLREDFIPEMKRTSEELDNGGS